MKKEDFIATIGYDGPVALVDKVRRSQGKQATVESLLTAGHFRMAAALAAYHENNAELEQVASVYSQKANTPYTAKSILRVFGIAKTEVSKILFL